MARNKHSYLTGNIEKSYVSSSAFIARNIAVCEKKQKKKQDEISLQALTELINKKNSS